MKVFNLGEKDYKLPNALNPFQKDLYIHLINWKWLYITKDVGYYNWRGKEIPYDAILPHNTKKDFPIIYPPVVDVVKKHNFKLHIHFNHMASSQAANVNLFLPVLLHPKVNEILRLLKPDFFRLATKELYKGFCIEYWGDINGKGLLGDHSKVSGTDSDIAIAYYNNKREPCLWLIEHKLAEKEFTKCGGFKSKGRKAKHDCSKSFSDIVINKNLCYYHDIRKFEYWNITDRNQAFFSNNNKHDSCPFQGGLNQLWRNQLLALSIEQDDKLPYQHVYFSVVRHPQNKHLDKSISQYEELIKYNPKFSAFSSVDLIKAAGKSCNPDLDKWIQWYKELYDL